MTYKIETRGISKTGKEYSYTKESNDRDYGRAIEAVNKYANKKAKKGKTKKPKKLSYKSGSISKRIGLPSYSAKKVLKRLASEQGALVREPPEIKREPLNENSLFKKEMEKERKSWLFK